jgi:hypothetical protein
MGLIDKAKKKLGYECESYRMSQEHLKKVAEELPFPKFSERIRMTDADLARWRREQRRKGGQ